MKMIENIKNTVGFIYMFDDVLQEYTALGTGFFAYVTQEDKIFHYLVTCKHVVDKHIDVDPLYVRLTRIDGQGVWFVPLESKWEYHKDKTIDLAVTPFEQTTDVLCEYEAVNADVVFMLKEQIENLLEGETIAFLGLLTKIPGKNKNTPIYRYGNIAMKVDGKLWGSYGEARYLLVECVAYKGNSGSPLWVSIDTPTPMFPFRRTLYILGVMTQIYLVEEIESLSSVKTAYNSGLSLAVPIYYVREILLGEKLMNDRKKRIKKSVSDSDKPIPISADTKKTDEKPFTRDDFFRALTKASRPDDNDEKDKDDRPE